MEALMGEDCKGFGGADSRARRATPSTPPLQQCDDPKRDE